LGQIGGKIGENPLPRFDDEHTEVTLFQKVSLLYVFQQLAQISKIHQQENERQRRNFAA
jgi:hypothetical protein